MATTYEYARHVHPIDGPEFGRQLTSVMATYAPEVASLQLNLLNSHDTPRFISLAGGDAAALRLATDGPRRLGRDQRARLLITSGHER